MNLASVGRKYGIYQVENLEFLLLEEAQQHAKKVSAAVKNSMFGLESLDLSQDPFAGLTISDLYRLRAQELRDSYDYLVLNVSGGPDSMNILKTFVNNNIVLDEIINYNSLDSTGIVQSANNNTDYVYNVKPILQELTKRPGWRTRFTILDEVELVQKCIAQAYDSGNESLLFGHGGPNSLTSVRGQGIQHVQHVWNMIQNGKKVGLITGVDKPFCSEINGERFLMLTDNNREQFVEFIIEHQVPAYWEWFYQGDFRIVSKQTYLLEQFVKNNQDSDLYEPKTAMTSKTRPAHRWPSANAKYELKYHPFHQIIYPDYQAKIVTPKDFNTLMRPRDNWWLYKANSRLAKMYAQTIVKWHHGRWQPDKTNQANWVPQSMKSDMIKIIT